MKTWAWAGLVAGLYCVVRAIADFWQGSLAWGAVGIVCGALLLLTPIAPRVAKYDVLPPDGS